MVEYACAALYATPALVGAVLIPAAYIGLAIYRRSRRIVIQEPPLTLTLKEFEQKARCRPSAGRPLSSERAAFLKAGP